MTDPGAADDTVLLVRGDGHRVGHGGTSRRISARVVI
jgi:hypothetical protein